MARRGRPEKLTFEKLYNDGFKKSQPWTAKRVVRWIPVGYMSIDLWIDDGSILVYNGERNETKITERRWK